MSEPILSFPFDPAARQVLREALLRGSVVAYPTETAYALGGNALEPALCQEVIRLKGRPAEKSLLLLIEGEAMLAALAREVAPAARVLIERFWPGPLTLVFPAAVGLAPPIADARGTVALRWSPHPVVRELLALGGVPLIGTSANRSGAPPLRTPEAVREAFGEAVKIVVGDDAAFRAAALEEWGEAPSTLVDATVEPFRVLREGAVAKSLIQAALVETFILAVPE